MIGHDGTPGRRFPLGEPQTDLGRTEGDIQLRHDPYVCPRHARFLRENGILSVRDLGSVNRIYLRIRGSADLAHDDLVLVGLEVLRFEVVEDPKGDAVQSRGGSPTLEVAPGASEDLGRGFEPAVERGTRVFGSPAGPRHARLCQRTVEGVTRNVYYLGTPRTTIGREEGDLIFAQDAFMSRRHAAIERDAQTGRFLLRDLGSSNGTFLAIRGRTELRSGDHLRIGQHLFRVDTGAAESR